MTWSAAFPRSRDEADAVGTLEGRRFGRWLVNLPIFVAVPCMAENLGNRRLPGTFQRVPGLYVPFQPNKLPNQSAR